MPLHLALDDVVLGVTYVEHVTHNHFAPLVQAAEQADQACATSAPSRGNGKLQSRRAKMVFRIFEETPTGHCNTVIASCKRTEKAAGMWTPKYSKQIPATNMDADSARVRWGFGG